MAFYSNNSSSFKIAVTLTSQIWTALVGFILTPVYIRLIGVESFGLVAFFTSLTTSLTILDLGLSTSVSRQLSIMSADGSTREDQRVLLFSIERVYWGIALLLGILIVFLSYPIAVYWVNSRELSTAIIQKSVMLMGVAFAFQWPIAIYLGSLTGLQKQTKSATITLTYVTLRAIALYIALKYISNTIECFFIVQIITTFIQVMLYRVMTWRELQLAGHKPVFSGSQLHKIKRFAAGITGISLVSFALTQIDKIVVSKLVLLEFVGYYNLAFALSNIMITIVSPMQTVFFPKFSSLVAAGKKQEVIELFRKASRWISIIVIPIGSMFVIFSKEILFLWTKNPVLTEQTAPILRFVAIGTVCHSLMWVPYFYMLAKGVTRFSIYQNIIASIILTPLLFWWTSRYGAFGASLVWFTVNVGYVVISLPLFHHLYLKGYLKEWYINYLIRPVLVTVPLVFLCKMALDRADFHYNYFSFGFVLICLVLVYSLLTKEIREFLFDFYNKKLNRHNGS